MAFATRGLGALGLVDALAQVQARRLDDFESGHQLSRRKRRATLHYPCQLQDGVSHAGGICQYVLSGEGVQNADLRHDLNHCLRASLHLSKAARNSDRPEARQRNPRQPVFSHLDLSAQTLSEDWIQKRAVLQSSGQGERPAPNIERGIECVLSGVASIHTSNDERNGDCECRRKNDRHPGNHCLQRGGIDPQSDARIEGDGQQHRHPSRAHSRGDPIPLRHQPMTPRFPERING
jgi:hypothetical protein